MAEKTYEDGIRDGISDGKIQAIEDMQVAQNGRLDGHNKRISTLERVMYGLMAVVLFIQFFPELKGFLSG